MSEQTDELLLITSLDKKDTEAEQDQREANSNIKRAARQRLQWLVDLEKQPGYQVLIEALQFEAKQAFLAMDKADNPTKLARYSGEHYAATMAVDYVKAESTRLRALLLQAA